MRYLPHTPEDVRGMMRTLGIDDVSDLFGSIPPEVRLSGPLHIPQALSEIDLDRVMRELANRSSDCSGANCFLGGGAYRHFVPAAIDAITSRSEFVTAYTPYQPEASQGTLHAIFEFQSMVCMLTGMEVANASMYDGAQAAAEAALMSLRLCRGKRKKIAVARSMHPEYRRTLKTYVGFQDVEIVEIEFDTVSGRIDMAAIEKTIDEQFASLIVQCPNFFGVVEEIKKISSLLSGKEASLIVATSEPLSLAAIAPPGELGADIACGEMQSFGMYPSFGGPGAGFLASKMDYVRNMPGRLVGETVDAEGQVGYCLTLSTREQHIRRERATSNICTNQSLMALRAAVYMSLMGKIGLRNLAVANLSLSEYAKKELSKKSPLKFSAPTFNEFVVKTSGKASIELTRIEEKGMLAGIDLGRWYPELDDCALVCVTELNTKKEIDKLASNWAS